jgi:hypothetical protein
MAKGEMPNAVVNIWTKIWQRNKELNRKFGSGNLYRREIN